MKAEYKCVYQFQDGNCVYCKRGRDRVKCKPVGCIWVLPPKSFSNKIAVMNPVASLHHKATHTVIHVYKRMNWFQRIMIRWCFGLEYRKL